MTSDSEVLAQARALAGVCARCGGDLRWTLEEAREIVAQDAALDGDPVLQATVRRLGQRLYCGFCVKAYLRESSEEKRLSKQRELVGRTYRDGLMPAEARGMTFAHSSGGVEQRCPALWSAVRAFPLKESLWIVGEPGTGKTFAARCAANQYLAQFRTAGELSALRVQEIGHLFHQERELRRFGEVNLLVLEDLDKPAWTSEGIAALWRLVDMRAGKGLRLIVTSNEDRKTLEMRWLALPSVTGATVYSLWDRMRPMDRVEVRGASLRKAG